MKLSMWMIANALAKYEPEIDIRNGSACIEGVRFLSQGGGDILPQFVYILCSSQPDHIRLMNNGSMVTIRGVSEPDRVFNDLFALFDRCDAWEKSLLEAADRRSFQAILDAAGELLENPMMLSDMDGIVAELLSGARMDDELLDKLELGCAKALGGSSSSTTPITATPPIAGICLAGCKGPPCPASISCIKTGSSP